MERFAGAPPHTLSRYLPVGLYTLPLHSTAEELQKDSRAYFVLAEHAAALRPETETKRKTSICTIFCSN